MGWGSFLGDLAKGFAEGYIEERGVKGTLEDIGDLASGIFSDPNSNSKEYSEDDWNQLINSIDNLIENGEYINALNQLDNFYNEYEDGEADSYYFYYRSLILTEYLESEVGRDDFNEIRDALRKAIKEGQSFNDKNLKDGFSGLKERIEEAEASNKELIAWYDLRKRVDRLCDCEAFNEAERIVSNWYENNDKDMFYPFLLAQINISIHKHDLSEGKVPPIEGVKATEALIGMTARFENSSDLCKSLTDELNDIKSRSAVIQQSSVTKENKESHKSLSDSENEYIEEVKACLMDDGEISAKERRLLDKLCKSLGISEGRASELEVMVKSNKMDLTDSEKEYLEEVKACLMDDGEISVKERRLLNKLCMTLGISEERAKELEDFAMNEMS